MKYIWTSYELLFAQCDADNNWRGYDLHEISKYLIDNNKYIPIIHLSKRLRKYDSMVTYPLLGSFAKFIDHTYGRETTKFIWKNGKKKMKESIGKNLLDLEQEWLEMLMSVSYKNIEYLK